MKVTEFITADTHPELINAKSITLTFELDDPACPLFMAVGPNNVTWRDRECETEYIMRHSGAEIEFPEDKEGDSK